MGGRRQIINLCRLFPLLYFALSFRYFGGNIYVYDLEVIHMEKNIGVDFLEWLQQRRAEISVEVPLVELTLEREEPRNIPSVYKDSENATQVERGSVIVDHSIYDGGSDE